MLEFPGGRGIGGIRCEGKYVGNSGGVLEMERYLYSIVIVIVFFSMFEKSKMTLKNRKAFDIM